MDTGGMHPVLVRIPSVCGILVCNHQDDVLVGDTILAEYLVNPKRVHRMSVIEPVPAGGDDDCMDVRSSLNVVFQSTRSRKNRPIGQATSSAEKK